MEGEEESGSCRISFPCGSAPMLCHDLQLLLLAVSPSFFLSPGKRGEQGVRHLEAGQCIGRLLVSFNEFSILMCNVGAL